MKSIKSIYYDIKNGIENLIVYFPLIWKTREWDHHFIYTMLRFKLYRVESHIRKHANFVGHERVCEDIKKCELLLDRIINDNYIFLAGLDDHDKKWGRAYDLFVDSVRFPGFLEYDPKRENVKNEADKEKERGEYLLIATKSEELKKQDLDMLFMLLRKHIESWWD